MAEECGIADIRLGRDLAHRELFEWPLFEQRQKRAAQDRTCPGRPRRAGRCGLIAFGWIIHTTCYLQSIYQAVYRREFVLMPSMTKSLMADVICSSLARSRGKIQLLNMIEASTVTKVTRTSRSGSTLGL